MRPGGIRFSSSGFSLSLKQLILFRPAAFLCRWCKAMQWSHANWLKNTLLIAVNLLFLVKWTVFLLSSLLRKEFTKLILAYLMWPERSDTAELTCSGLCFFFFFSFPLRYGLPEVSLPTVCQVQPLPPLLHLNRSKNIHLQLLEWWDPSTDLHIEVCLRLWPRFFHVFLCPPPHQTLITETCMWTAAIIWLFSTAREPIPTQQVSSITKTHPQGFKWV